MLRYRLRTLLILLALGPPVLAFGGLAAARAYREWQRPAREIVIGFTGVKSFRAPANHPNAPRP